MTSQTRGGGAGSPAPLLGPAISLSLLAAALQVLVHGAVDVRVLTAAAAALAAVGVMAVPPVRDLALTTWSGWPLRMSWSLAVAEVAALVVLLLPGRTPLAPRLLESVGLAATTLVAALVVAAVATPWSGVDPWVRDVRPTAAHLRRGGLRLAAVVGVAAVTVAGLTSPAASTPSVAPVAAADDPCRPGQSRPTRTVTADVVSLDQQFDYNRLGATNPAGMMFALRHDVVLSTDVAGVAAGTPLTDGAVSGLTGDQLAGHVMLRPDLRPRPLTLRMSVGDCLRIEFQNLLDPQRRDAEQPADRHVGIHVKGLAVVNGTEDDGTFVGRNASSLAAPGNRRTYVLYGEHENGFVMDNGAALAAGEAAGGTTPFGLFGAVNVEPWGTDAYRSQLTRMEMDLAASAWTLDGQARAEPRVADDGTLAVLTTPDGQPILNYDAVYPTDPTVPGYDAARAGLPILRVTDGSGRIVHGDLNAVIAGPRGNDYRIPAADYPASYWDNQVVNENQARGQEPFREFTVIFHDEFFALQAFPDMFNDPATFQHTLHGVRDGFGINYGSAGAGAEIIANRLGVGPMRDCAECKYEEFFLTSWAVGDPAMVVDVPANQVLAGAAPGATYAKFPADPSNVHHSYLNDRVKFRNLHAGPKEHHIFHLHAHQWQQSPNDERSSYLDSQLIGPGASYTYDIAYGGSGNRNKTVGDSIFHCHFYPHFAQGMWELWRTHDTFERGTLMDGNVPAAGSRALPDGEIVAGTPIPAIVPLPGRPMAPSPDPRTTVVPFDIDGAGPAPATSQVDVDGDGTADVSEAGFAGVDATVNPGYPFFIAGVAGHRPPTAPLDVQDDGGLPRHIIVGGSATSTVTPRDMNKVIDTAWVVYPDETGTAAERAAMAYHARTWHPTYDTSGAVVDADHVQVTGGVGREVRGFETNGLDPVAGAPFADPCRTDGTGDPAIHHAGGAPRVLKAAVFQFDAIFNKAGWHFPQQRIESLWEDAAPTIRGTRAPEPLVMRLAAGDCAELLHTNLVPNVYELDDYQVRTPTDVIGQHIHLVKFDVTSADGSGNGWNYEDGTLSPQEVEERIHAVRAGTEAGGQPFVPGVDAHTCQNGGGNARQNAGEEPGNLGCPLAVEHPFFGTQQGIGDVAWGARTTVQRWYADPVLNDAWDGGVGSVFTHDHFGPSTHQQTGLYATVLVEPAGSTWRDPETGVAYGSRHDGGPTSWRADILTADPGQSHREFYLEFGDFEHAYQAGGGALHTDDNLAGVQIPSYADPANVINPSHRVPAPSTPDLWQIPAVCPNGTPRPCPEAISADDIGTMLVNYRNEPVAQRVFDPVTRTQAAGPAGDLALAFQSRTDRAMAELNSQPATYPRPSYVQPGDPFTPLLRAYAGDDIRVRVQVGATEEQHNVTIQGLKWRDEPLSQGSGWVNGKPGGISEYFVLESPVVPNSGRGSPASVDHLWATGAATDDLWNGAWGLLRSYQKERKDLLRLPTNAIPSTGWTISNPRDFDSFGVCPATAKTKTFSVSAVRAADLLGADGIVYNDRGATVVAADGTVQAAGRLIDPTALMYVLDGDLVIDKVTGAVKGLKQGVPVEPLTLRVNAGDCISVKLTNRLPATVPDKPGYNALPPIVHKVEAADGTQISFNANDIVPSSTVGLHPQLLTYDQRTSNGMDTGGTLSGSVPAGQSKTYRWYAGNVTATPVSASSMRLTARPVEFGAVGLMPADLIEGPSHGLVGALVVEPPGATWATDQGSRMSATVTVAGGTSFRELVAVLQDDVNLRYAGACPGVPADLQCAVPAIASEGMGVPEDAEDSGSKAINYRSDPLWYRLGIAPDTPFESPMVRDNTDVHRVLSNDLVGGDPSVPILTAAAGQQVRLRVVQPGGHARGHVISVNGHSWQRQPAVPDTTASSDLSERIAWAFPSDPTTQDASSPGHEVRSTWTGAQDGMGPAVHHDMVIPQAGGPFARPGDYLIRDSASFGSYQGLWALLRVTAGG